MIGLSAGGEGLLRLMLNGPDCAQHKTPSVSVGERERDRKRRRERGMWGRGGGRRELPAESQVL